MTDARVGEKEQAKRAWFDASLEGQLPARRDTSRASGARAAMGAEGAAVESTGAKWKRRLLRVVRDAAICVALITAVPIGLTVYGPAIMRQSVSPDIGLNTTRKLREAERSRPFKIAVDPAVSPAAAGVALASLVPEREQGPFTFRRTVPPDAVPWKGRKIPASLDHRVSRSWDGPSEKTVLKDAAGRLSPADIEYLRMIAMAPLWNAYDLAAKAPTVDVLGGRFALPFPASAHSWEMPIHRFAATKELAYASVSRAAYYLAIGRPAEAEAALRSTIGYGFIFIDNSSSLIDALIGRVIVGIGRSALEDLFTITHDPRLAEVRRAGIALPVVQNRNVVGLGSSITAREARRMLLDDAANPLLPRAVRLLRLEQLSQTVCTNPQELILGPAQDVHDAYARAGRDLVRFPSEQALLDLQLQSPNRPFDPRSMGLRISFPGGSTLLAASTVASRIWDNPRMSYCALRIVGPLQ